MLRALNFEFYSRINQKQALYNAKLTWVLRGKMHALSFRHFSLNKDAESSYYPVRDNGSQIDQKHKQTPKFLMSRYYSGIITFIIHHYTFLNAQLIYKIKIKLWTMTKQQRLASSSANLEMRFAMPI